MHATIKAQTCRLIGKT